jgi:bifunctional DNA-binding transcriptional regulator/antitoxin component of YhaV-PrlF toxin-antitoxin module
MASIQEYVVSSSGQLSLPAAARHRWNLDEGGPVDVIDLGFAVMMLPRGEGRRLLNDLLPRDSHAEFVASLCGDPDLATM